MTELSGYNFKRQEFENEYDNDAEQLLSDMEFKKTDTDAEHELKLRVLRIYNKRYAALFLLFLLPTNENSWICAHFCAIDKDLAKADKQRKNLKMELEKTI